MVIGERFAWAHIGKTGGDATLFFFQCFPELIHFADRSDSPEKHLSFAVRERQIAGKVLAANLRRLPAWMLSQAQHESRFRYGTVVEIASADEIAARRLGDDELEQLGGNGRLPVECWLRTEFLADDFLRFLGEFTDVPPERALQVRNSGLINAMDYDHNLAHWFKPAHVEEMYRRNPQWAALERELYGGIVELD